MDRSSLAPGLLLAMPQMQDPNFARSVVLLCEHSAEGTMGLVINRPTTTLVSLIVELDETMPSESDVKVWVGGPVETSRAWILSADDPATSDRIVIADELFLSASRDALRLCLKAQPPARDRYRFLLGYAGWGAGQLEAELAQSAWLTAPIDLRLVFETAADDMWDAGIRGLGIDPQMLQMGPGVH